MYFAGAAGAAFRENSTNSTITKLGFVCGITIPTLLKLSHFPATASHEATNTVTPRAFSPRQLNRPQVGKQQKHAAAQAKITSPPPETLKDK